MAGPFYNPAAGMGIEAAGASAVESPVAPVRTSAADTVTAGLNLASQGVAMYGQYQRSQGRYGGTRSGRPDPNVAVFAEEMNKVQQIRSEKGDLAGRLAERSVASNFAAAGVSLKDTAYQSVYESTTGRSFDLYGRDDDEYFRQKSLERPEVQAAFMASNAMLPPGTSTEERLEWSLNEVREQQAAVLKLSQAQNNATMAWQVGGEEGTGSSKAFRTVRQGFVSRFSGGLLKKFEDGELVTPKDIAMAKVEWTTLKANALRRPPNLSGAAGDAQWRAFEAGNTSIDNLFTSLESATSNETFLNSQVTIIANEVKKSSSFSKLEKIYITAGLFSKDPNVYLGMLGETHGDLFKRLSELKISPTASPSDALNNPGFTPIPSSRSNLPLGLRSTVSYEIKDDEKTKYTGMTGKEIANQIIATAAHAKVFVPGSMSKAENREAFGKTMTGMIAALQSSDQKDFFSPAYLRNHVLNPTILATLEAYKKSDPDQADLLRGGLQLGYQMEKTRQQQSLSSIEARENIARYTRFNEETNSYELNVNEFSSGFAGSVTAFNDALRDHYNNNISEAARDKFDKIVNTGGRVSLDILQGNVARNVVIFADLDELTHAVKRRDAIAALDKGILSLDPEPRETELNQGQTMDQAPPPPPAIVQPAGATSGISSVNEGGDGFTTVTKADGTVVKREGLRSWRNNNPGNLEEGDFATSKGAVGDDGRYAVFKTYEEGREAMRSLLFEGKNYRGKTISEAITRYAPPKENDTALYIKRVTDALGVSDSTKLSDLNDDQRVTMLDAMQKHEGFKEGTETVVEPSSGTGLDSQGRPFLRPEAGAEVTQGNMLGGVISSIKSALNLGSDEEAQSIAEKLMQSGVIPLPPRRPTEQGMAEANQLTPSEQRIADAQARLEERNKSNQGLNKETLSLVESSVPSVNWLRSLGSAVGNLVAGSPAQAAEYKEKVDKAIEFSSKNPIEFIYKVGNLVGLDENNPEHQKAIAGFTNQFFKGRIEPFSEVTKDKNAWCAAFVAHVLTNLGFNAPDGNQPRGKDRYDVLRAKAYKNIGKGVELGEAKPGDLVIIKNPQNGINHVGFFVDSTSKGIAILGGNQGDQVNVTRYPSERLQAIRRIDGMEDINPEALKAVQKDISEVAGVSLSNLYHRISDSAVGRALGRIL